MNNIATEKTAVIVKCGYAIALEVDDLEFASMVLSLWFDHQAAAKSPAARPLQLPGIHCDDYYRKPPSAPPDDPDFEVKS